MSLKAIIDLPDDWERGCCWNCPFSYKQFGDIYDYEYCSLSYNDRCELMVVDSKGEMNYERSKTDN